MITMQSGHGGVEDVKTLFILRKEGSSAAYWFFESVGVPLRQRQSAAQVPPRITVAVINRMTLRDRDTEDICSMIRVVIRI